jgi:hypothetical protein
MAPRAGAEGRYRAGLSFRATGSKSLVVEAALSPATAARNLLHGRRSNSNDCEPGAAAYQDSYCDPVLGVTEADLDGEDKA